MKEQYKKLKKLEDTYVLQILDLNALWLFIYLFVVFDSFCLSVDPVFSAKACQAKMSKLRNNFRELEKNIKKKETAEKNQVFWLF